VTGVGGIGAILQLINPNNAGNQGSALDFYVGNNAPTNVLGVRLSDSAFSGGVGSETDRFFIQTRVSGTLATRLTIDETGAFVLTGNQTISNTAPALVLTDTTALAKSLTIAVDANKADFRESAGASGSLLFLDLASNLVGIGGTPVSTLHLLGATAPKFSMSDTGLAHGVTDFAPTDAFFHVDQATDNAGGARLWGFSSTVGLRPMSIFGIFGNTNPTDTVPGIWLLAAKRSGTNIVDLGALETVLQVGSAATGNNYLTVLGSGNVGIGTTTPSTPLHVLSATDNATLITATINIASASITTADTFVDFRSSAGSIGSIAGTAVSGTIIYNTFTGAHWTEIADRHGLEIGMLLESTGEPLDDFASMTKSQVCGRRASKAAWGMYNGQNNEGRDSAEAIGKGLCWVVNKGEPLEVGDFVMSSDVPGACEKQVAGSFGFNVNDLPEPVSEIIRHLVARVEELERSGYRNSSVAKVMQPVVWKPGEQLRKAVACIYLGG
jgi:hypothetical protein